MLWLMKRTFRIVFITIILVLGLTAINKTKDHKLKTENIKVNAESSITNVEPPVIEEPPKEVVDTAPAGNVQSVSASGDPRGYRGLASCITSRVRAWRFPASSGQTTVNVPFVFAAQ